MTTIIAKLSTEILNYGKNSRSDFYMPKPHNSYKLPSVYQCFNFYEKSEKSNTCNHKRLINFVVVVKSRQQLAKRRL